MNPLTRDIIALVVGYLLGGILPAYIISRLKGFDIRTRGSGNPGARNVAEVIGYGAATLTAMFDISKSILAILIARWLGAGEYVCFAAGFSAIVGHTKPIYLRFRGGRGEAAAVGIILYSIISLTKRDTRFLYILTPVLLMIGVVFSFHKKRDVSNIMALGLFPIIPLSSLLFFELDAFNVSLLVASFWVIGQRVELSLKERILRLSQDERKLLKRKWLRPLAIVFPLGILFHKAATLYLLGAVLFVFAVFELLRFTTRFRWFPLRYKKTEQHRLSSMAMFLFASFLTLLFFQKNIASLALMFTIYGDLAAWCVGFGVGKKEFLGKTWQGTVACFVMCCAIALIYFRLYLAPLITGIVGAASATIMEAAPIQDDNFAIPIVSAIVMAVFNNWVI